MVVEVGAISRKFASNPISEKNGFFPLPLFHVFEKYSDTLYERINL